FSGTGFRSLQDEFRHRVDACYRIFGIDRFPRHNYRHSPECVARGTYGIDPRYESWLRSLDASGCSFVHRADGGCLVHLDEGYVQARNKAHPGWSGTHSQRMGQTWTDVAW